MTYPHMRSYFFLPIQAIPHAVAMVRAADRRSPREAVEFVLQLLKVNSVVNNSNFSYMSVVSKLFDGFCFSLAV